MRGFADPTGFDGGNVDRPEGAGVAEGMCPCQLRPVLVGRKFELGGSRAGEIELNDAGGDGLVDLKDQIDFRTFPTFQVSPVFGYGYRF